MAKKKGRRRSKFRVYLAPTAGAAAGLVEPFNRARFGDIMGAVDELSLAYLGYSPKTKKFDIGSMARGTLPLVVGALVHIAASKTGVNRALGQAKVPIFRI